MGSLGDLIRQGHSPGSPTPAPIINFQKTKPPVKFTTDPIEYIESKEYLGEKLYTKQKDIVNDFFSRDPSGKRNFNELILIVGMRGGKSILAGWIGSFCANYLMSMGRDYKEHYGLSKRSNISIPIIANSEDQAEKTIYGYIKQNHTNTDFWKKVNQWLMDMEPLGMKGSYFNEAQSSLNYRYYDLNIHCVPSTSDTLAGLTSFCTLFDEISRLRVSNSSGDIQGKSEKKSAQAIYYTLIRQIKTFRNEGNSIVVSSPMYEDDFGMQLLLKSGTVKTGSIGEFTIPILADKIPDNQKKRTRIGYQYATWEYNESFTEEDFTDEKKESITTFKRDYMAVPPASIEPFFEDRLALRAAINPNREHIVKCETLFVDKHRKDQIGNIIDTRRYVTKKIETSITDKMTKRFICCDQGHKWDNFVLTIGHPEPVTVASENGLTKKFLKTIIDAIIVWEPLGEEAQVEFENVEVVILDLCERLLIECVTYDRWQSTKPIQTLFDRNVNSQVLSITNSMYQSFKKRIYQGLVDSVDVNYEFSKKTNALMDEMIKLQLIKGGKVDHTPNSSKDIVDTVCRLDAIIQNLEYEEYGSNKGNLKGGLAYINPSDESFSVQQVENALAQSYGGDSNIWASGDAPTPRMSKSIWGRPGIKRTKDVRSRDQHPAQNFFKQKG